MFVDVLQICNISGLLFFIFFQFNSFRIYFYLAAGKRERGGERERGETDFSGRSQANWNPRDGNYIIATGHVPRTPSQNRNSKINLFDWEPIYL